MSIYKVQPKACFASVWLQVFAVMVLGGLHAVALSYMAQPEKSGAWLQILALAGLAILVAESRSPWRAALLGWLFASVWLTGSVWWLYISMHDYGGMPSIMAAIAVFLLCGGLAIIYGIAMALVRKVSSSQNLSILVFAAAWLLAELTRGWIFTGFPWAASGYAHVDRWLVVYAPWVGVYGVSALSAILAASIASIWFFVGSAKCSRRQVLIASAWLLVILGGALLVRTDFTESTGEVKVALLQGNVPQDLKFEPAPMLRTINWYVSALESAKQEHVDLVITPETALPTFINYLPAGLWDRLNADFSTNQTAAIIGIPTLDEQGQFTNSLIALAPGQGVYQYDKYHLVPFGEFIPWGFQWFVDMMEIPLGDFKRGSVDAPSFAWQGQRIAPNICYEDLFGEELARRFSTPGQDPTIMVNASNIAWFGNTVAVPQHLQIARMRAMEFQRPMIRATNTGATAIIDHTGGVLQMLEPYTQGVLIGTVQGRTGLTPYAWWAGQWGVLPLWVLSIGILAFSGLRTRQAI